MIKIKQTTMKNLFLATLLTLIGGSAFTQERELTDECKKNIGYIAVYAEQNLWQDAVDFWNKAIATCGTDKFISAEWSNARTIYTNLMEIDTAAARQTELQDSIYWCYDMQMKSNPTADLAAEFAAKLVKGESRDREKIDGLWNQSVHTLKAKLSINEMILYFYHVVTKYNLADEGEAKEEARNYAIEEYLKLSDYISTARKAFIEKGNDKAVAGYERAQGYLDNYFTQLAKDCEMLTEVLGRKVGALPTAKEDKLAKVQGFLSILEKRGCDDSDLYGQLADTLISIEPTPEAYFSQGNYYLKKENTSKAKSYYEKAIEMEGAEGENIDKYTYYLANALANSNSHRAAFNMAKKVSGEFKGKAMLICASAIGSMANSCGETTFERKANYWLADDYMKRASAAGESYSSRYANGAPSTEEIFAAGKAAGQSISLSCWGESSTIR